PPPDHQNPLLHPLGRDIRKVPCLGPPGPDTLSLSHPGTAGARGSDPSNANIACLFAEGVRTMFGLGAQELMILLVLGILLFGKKVREVGRSRGKGRVEFKKGLQGIEDDVAGSTRASDPAPPPPPRPPQRIAASAPKFEEPSHPQPNV